MKKLVKKYGTLSRQELMEIQGGSGGGCQGNQSLCRLRPSNDSQKCCSGYKCKKISGNILGICVESSGGGIPT